MATDDELRFVEHQAQFLYQETDKALMGDFHLNITEIGSFEDWFILLVTEPAYVSEFYGKQTESIIENLALYHQAVGDRLTAMYFGQDFGTQQGPMIAPATFRRLLAPHYKRIFEWVHANTAWKVFFHTCGSVYDFIPDFIQMGVDILNPIQTGAARMHPADLKKEFGHQLCFWGGGVDVQRLPFMPETEVRQQVREHVEALAPDGGFVFSATHNIQANTPPENILAAFEAAYEYGQYA
jgi:uroporphyrinogen-III decarboxylase